MLAALCKTQPASLHVTMYLMLYIYIYNKNVPKNPILYLNQLPLTVRVHEANTSLRQHCQETNSSNGAMFVAQASSVSVRHTTLVLPAIIISVSPYRLVSPLSPFRGSLHLALDIYGPYTLSLNVSICTSSHARVHLSLISLSCLYLSVSVDFCRLEPRRHHLHSIEGCRTFPNL